MKKKSMLLSVLSPVLLIAGMAGCGAPGDPTGTNQHFAADILISCGTAKNPIHCNGYFGCPETVYCTDQYGNTIAPSAAGQCTWNGQTYSSPGDVMAAADSSTCVSPTPTPTPTPTPSPSPHCPT